MRYLYKKRFLEAFDSLSVKDQALVREADREIRAYHDRQRAPVGLRIKKLLQAGDQAVYEARPSLALRMIWAESGSLAAFLLLGSHDEVRRLLRRL